MQTDLCRIGLTSIPSKSRAFVHRATTEVPPPGESRKSPLRSCRYPDGKSRSKFLKKTPNPGISNTQSNARPVTKPANPEVRFQKPKATSFVRRHRLA